MMATRNALPPDLDARLRAARPPAPRPPHGYTQRVWARIHTAPAPRANPALLVPLALALVAAVALGLWWLLGGPWFALSTTVRALAPYAGAATWLWTRAPWLFALAALGWFATGLQALGAGWWMRRYCRVRGCGPLAPLSPRARGATPSAGGPP